MLMGREALVCEHVRKDQTWSISSVGETIWKVILRKFSRTTRSKDLTECFQMFLSAAKLPQQLVTSLQIFCYIQDFFAGQLLLPNLLTFFLQHSEKQTRNKQNWLFLYACGDLLSLPAENQRLHNFAWSDNRGGQIRFIKDIWFYVFSCSGQLNSQ